MFDTMTLTKLVGGVCGALLIFLFGNWAAESIYGFGEEGHGEEVALAYSVEGAETADAGTETAAVEEAPFADLIAVADVAAGEQTFGKCKSCHKIDGANGTGPHLNGVVGRNHGSVPDFKYSDAMLAKSAEVWTEEEIFHFIKNPKEYLPGTKMGFDGLAKPEDRANVVAYLASLK